MALFRTLGSFTENTYEPDQARTPQTVTGTTVYEEGETIRTFAKPEPRISVRGLLNESTSIKLSLQPTPSVCSFIIQYGFSYPSRYLAGEQ